MSAQIDWSNAPEGATHYYPLTEEWYLVGYGCVPLVWTGMWCKAFQFAKREDKCVQRPTTPSWSGEGLPPVGVVCEYMAADELWIECEVVAHRNNAAIVIDNGYDCALVPARELRPIRTPGQIAADDREVAVAEMLGLFGGTDSRDTYLMQRLYDAGYRKQLTKQDGE